VLLVAVAAIVIVALLQLVQTSDAATSNFAIQQLEREKLELRTRTSQLEAEIAALSSLSRIEQEARERLGLEPAAAQQSLQVNVPWPGADQQLLPTRFAPDEEPEVVEQSDGSGWWRDLLGLLPFY
jgi:cell division protein FtsL